MPLTPRVRVTVRGSQKMAERTKNLCWSLLLSVLAVFFGAVGVFTGEFWFPSRMKRSISGPFGRVMGGLFLVFGLFGILVAIADLAGTGDESSHREERPVRPERKARKAVVRKPRPDEEAAAEYLGLISKEKERSRGDDELSEPPR
jgi:hypothetical protein